MSDNEEKPASGAPTQPPSLDTMRSVYVSRMGTTGLNLNDTAARFVVRVWDGMDGCWTDCTGDVDCEAALREWWKGTIGGTVRTSFNDIDYYRIFPAGTRMAWNGEEGRELFR